MFWKAFFEKMSIFFILEWPATLAKMCFEWPATLKLESEFFGSFLEFET